MKYILSLWNWEDISKHDKLSGEKTDQLHKSLI